MMIIDGDNKAMQDLIVEILGEGYNSLDEVAERIENLNRDLYFEFEFLRSKYSEEKTSMKFIDFVKGFDSDGSCVYINSDGDCTLFPKPCKGKYDDCELYNDYQAYKESIEKEEKERQKELAEGYIEEHRKAHVNFNESINKFIKYAQAQGDETGDEYYAIIKNPLNEFILNNGISSPWELYLIESTLTGFINELIEQKEDSKNICILILTYIEFLTKGEI